MASFEFSYQCPVCEEEDAVECYVEMDGWRALVDFELSCDCTMTREQEQALYEQASDDAVDNMRGLLDSLRDEYYERAYDEAKSEGALE